MADGHSYNDAGMIRGAEERVREMRRRSLLAAQDMEGEAIPMPSFVNPNRNWNPNPNGRQTQSPLPVPRPEPEPETTPPPAIPLPEEAPPLPPAEDSDANESRQQQAEAVGGNPTTLVEDMVGRLGLESDTLLIIGLILILINQKADNTLILALAYLLL